MCSSFHDDFMTPSSLPVMGIRRVLEEYMGFHDDDHVMTKEKAKDSGQPKTRNVLAFQYNGFGVLVPAMLLTSLTLNMVALSLPFMVMRVFGEPSESYSILRTVSLMWEFKFYWVAILIVVFSVCFPFVKLASLFLLWYLPLKSRFRGRGIHILCDLGRWSLLDVFVALVLIVLSHDQSLFVTSTKAGLPLFLIAICLSIGSGQLIAYLHMMSEGRPPIVKEAAVRPSSNAGWRTYVVPILLLGNVVALGAALGIPYIKITAWYLHKNSYSILDTIMAFWADEKYIFSLIVLAFLVAMPITRLVTITLLWYRRLPPERFRRAQEVARDVSLWSMLDVFALALLLIIGEGRTVIKIEQSSGVWPLLAAIIISSALSMVARKVIRSRLAAIAGKSTD